MIPAVAAEGLADAVDAFCEGIGFTPAQTRRVFEAAREPWPAGQAARRAAVEPERRGAGRRVRGAVGRPPGTSGRGRDRRHGRPARRDLLPGAFYFVRETKAAADRGPARGRRADGPGHRLQSRHLAPDLACC
jgi:imidazolonepropionase